MITVTICEENEKIRTMTGDAAFTITLKGITANAVKVDIGITGQMRADQTANALGNAMRVILKEIAENAPRAGINVAGNFYRPVFGR